MTQQHRFIPHLDEQQIRDIQLDGLKWTVKHAFEGSLAYRKKLEDVGLKPGDVKSLDDLSQLPFTTVEDLRDGYPMPLLSVPEEELVRIHASSGTTGKRKVLVYTQKDVDDWKGMMARCYELAELTRLDRVQICVGYGLWTAGAGFQLGCEHFGATAVPVGPGNMEIQMQLIKDMGTTCLCSTASMALLLGEEIEKQGLRDSIKLEKCIFGAEAHTPKMRKRFEELLGLKHSFDITGMTELYGPGAGLECTAHEGIHYWADMYILEILDPVTHQPVAPGEIGEMVVTSLHKQAAPLIRYRTHDLTRLIPGICSCGVTMPRHEKILGRSDDMIIFRGVNIYPGQIADVLHKFPDTGSEYQIQLTRSGGRDSMRIKVERAKDVHSGCDSELSKTVSDALHKQLMARAGVEIVDFGSLPRSFGKTKRVIDERG
ncbi:phenylacetate--CoA ligase family protein [Desulfovibrio ferrophilus]|uniref:Phenylacetate-coenzyme A ligase n=1 Tax=Desulfovibrio ferrophilus TaxID=241368 RepID=A0A2Z6B2T1_9BACT|nr:phenylacetate--CoA ligase [Desulfovibrio ferrophilus]BBD09748.1 phenylacetate--CoA ligase [Desulfovibrio ferrophilus]